MSRYKAIDCHGLVLPIMLLISSQALAVEDVATASNMQHHTCNWLIEVKRTNTWLERDQRERIKMGELFLTAKKNGTAVNQEERKAISERMHATDAILQGELEDLVARCGWPTTTEFGDKAPQYAATIVQHASLEFQLKYEPLMRASANANELPKRLWATLDDRIRVRKNLPQRYGTQLKTDGPELTLWPIEDEEHLDERRAEVDMVPVPICAYLGLFDQPIKYKKCEWGAPVTAP
ncbi:MAG: hypothetical protein K2W93_08020 [Burkholderiaceae bacterium]|nr:hypothetical protein [Burkholderiaceae bacterium]